MIAIAVVASLVTYAWVMGYMSFTTTKPAKQYKFKASPQADVANLLYTCKTLAIQLLSVSNPLCLSQRGVTYQLARSHSWTQMVQSASNCVHSTLHGTSALRKSSYIHHKSDHRLTELSAKSTRIPTFHKL